MRDPKQYAQFSDERSRPFWDLLARVPPKAFQEVVDLGCGTGELTRAIAERWPAARVLGLDSSARMLAGAGAFAEPGRIEFIEGDIADYGRPADLIFSNAALHWLDNHAALFPRLAGLVRPGGTLAVQMPSNFDQPSHLLMEETARDGPWTGKLSGWQQLTVGPLRWYVDLLFGLGFSVDAWETIYYFLLQGENPILEWVKGTSLQPVLALLDANEQAQFNAAYAERLRKAYPASAAGTLFPFKRIFFVANRGE